MKYIVIVLLVILVFAGCTQAEVNDSYENSRFQVIYSSGSDFNMAFRIVLDTETGVKYLFTKAGYGSGITPLLGRVYE